MSKRSSIVHIEWRSRNVAKLKDFYRAAFKWKFDENTPGYLLASSGGDGVGVGMMQIDGGSPVQPGVVAFLESRDLGASESAIREAGGHIVGAPQEVPGWGRFSLFTDPDGNPLGLWQSEGSVKKEEKRHKKAEKKRAKAASQAAPPADGRSDGQSVKSVKSAKKTEDKAKRKAEKRAQKLEKKAQKLAAKAEKRAHKLEKQAAKSAAKKDAATKKPKNKDKKKNGSDVAEAKS